MLLTVCLLSFVLKYICRAWIFVFDLQLLAAPEFPFTLSYFQILFEMLTTYMVLSCKLYLRWSLSNIIWKYNHFMIFKHSNPTVVQITSLCSFSCDSYRFDDNIGYFLWFSVVSMWPLFNALVAVQWFVFSLFIPL